MGTMAKRRAAAAATVLFLILYLMQMLVTGMPAANAVAAPEGNENCAAATGTDQILKLEGADLATGTYLATNGESITVTIFDDATFNWSSTGLIAAVFVKGGPVGNLYDYRPDGAYSDTGLHAPVNPANGQYYGLSHITFCEFTEPPTTTSTSTTTTTVPPSTTTTSTTSTSTTTTTTLPPEQPSATVTSECIPGGGTEITVDVENGAMVRIDGPGEDDPAFAADNSIVVDWPVGSYYWMAWAEQVEVVDKGSIEVVSCTTPPPPSSTTSTTTTTAAAVPVTITAACPTSGAAPAMTVNPAGGATVNLVDEGNGVFSWTAVAAEGYVIESGATGTFDLKVCADVLGTTIISTTSTTAEVQASTVAAVTASTLPFTGFEMERTLMLAVAALMVGAGLLLVSYGTPERTPSTIADRW